MEGRPAPERGVTYTHPDVDSTARLRELIVYIAAKSAYDQRFGVTKLNKLLWWSDTTAFGHLHRPITGATYKRLPQGPVPDGIDALRAEMVQQGEIAISPQDHYGKTQHRVVALRRADLSAFTGIEIAIVDAIIDEHSGRNATAVSNRSHGRMWEALPMGASMPYESVFVSDAKPTRYDMARTRQLREEVRVDVALGIWRCGGKRNTSSNLTATLGFTEELARIGDIQRLDEALGAVQLILTHDAEVFPVLKGFTKTRLAKTRAVDDVPALNIWYEIDGDDCVVLMWVEPVPESE